MNHLDFSVRALFPNYPNAKRDDRCICVANVLEELDSSHNIESQKDLVTLADHTYKTLCDGQKITIESASKLSSYFAKHGVSHRTASTYISFILKDSELVRWRSKI
jgi:hypothetical protein